MENKWTGEELSILFSEYDDSLERKYLFNPIVTYLSNDLGIHSVLDYGCGSGALTAILSGSGFKSVGIDISETSLSIARQRSERSGVVSEFRQPDETCFAIYRNSFDAAICAFLFCTIESLESIKKVIVEISKLLRESGVLIVTDFDMRACGFDYKTFYCGARDLNYSPGDRVGVTMRTTEGKEFSFDDFYWPIEVVNDMVIESRAFSAIPGYTDIVLPIGYVPGAPDPFYARVFQKNLKQ